MSFLDQLRAQGIEVRAHASDPNEYFICCVFCEFRNQQTPDTRFRLGINIRTRQGHCFNCGWSSRDNALAEVAEMLQMQYEEIGEEGVELKPKKKEEIELPEDFVLLSERPTGKLYHQAERYIKDRGIRDWQIREKKIGVSFVGKYAYRIIFPVYYKKELKGLVTRDFTGQQDPPYLNTAGMKSLYNCPKDQKSKAILCEGVFDCLAIEQIVKPEYAVMAVLGRSLTDHQEEQLDLIRDIILWPDADLPGVKGFMEIANRLRHGHRIFIVWPFGYGKDGYGKDASAMSADERKYAWATRTKFTDAVEMRLKAEVAFRDE